MIADSVNSLFLGTIPMGFATLISAWCSICIPYWGSWATTFAWVCWMIDSVVAVSVTISLTILLISASDRQALDRITAAQLLPIAASIVAAGTGARVAEHLPNPQHALGTIIASYVMWGMSTPLAMTVLVMYYTRLALHKLPPREIVVSSFLPLGPLGMGGYSITYLGMVSRRVFPETEFFSDIPVAGDIFFVVGIFIALIMWAFGLGSALPWHLSTSHARFRSTWAGGGSPFLLASWRLVRWNLETSFRVCFSGSWGRSLLLPSFYYGAW
jgi:hypothetical protein